LPSYTSIVIIIIIITRIIRIIIFLPSDRRHYSETKNYENSNVYLVVKVLQKKTAFPVHCRAIDSR